MCVSTWSRDTPGGRYRRARVQHLLSVRPAPSADLPYVVEVSVRNLLLSRQLLHLVQEDVHLKLGAQVLKATVAERLPAEVSRRRRRTYFI